MTQMQTTAARPIETRRVQPAIDRDLSAARPTEIRYGWCPFGDINLVGPDGTPNLYVQPHAIEDEEGRQIENPYHRVLPKGQLIPFPTFNASEQTPSPDMKDAQGRALLVTSTRAVPALEAISAVLQRHSGWGFTILTSLQGLDQDTAMRIFQVVSPFEYPLARMAEEFEVKAEQRIASRAPLTFDEVPGYVVEPLRTDEEREIANRLAAELAAGAGIAFDVANEVLNDTEISIKTRLAGGQGKVGPDPLDRRLQGELGRTVTSGTDNPNQDIKDRLDFLVSREEQRSDKEEIARLRAELAKRDAAAQPEPQTATLTCGAIKSDGTPCKATVEAEGDRCRHHPVEG